MADFDFKAASESMMDFIKKVETEIGPRLPGSDEERAGAKLIKEEYEKNIGIKPVSEPFKVAPESGIGSIPYIGIGGLIALIAFFIYPIAGAVIAALCFIYFALMGGFYTQIFDFLWKRKTPKTSIPCRSLCQARQTIPSCCPRTTTAVGTGTLQRKTPKRSFRKSFTAS